MKWRRTLFREFAENEVKPLAQEIDEQTVFPRETVAKMAKYGFIGIPVPKDTADRAVILLHMLCVLKNLSKVCGTTGVIVSAHTSLCVDPIMTFGTDQSRRRNMFLILLQAESLVLSVLLSQVLVQMLRDVRQRLF